MPNVAHTKNQILLRVGVWRTTWGVHVDSPSSSSFSSLLASLLSRRSCFSISALIRLDSFASSLRQQAIMESKVIPAWAGTACLNRFAVRRLTRSEKKRKFLSVRESVFSFSSILTWCGAECDLRWLMQSAVKCWQLSVRENPSRSPIMQRGAALSAAPTCANIHIWGWIIQWTAII